MRRLFAIILILSIPSSAFADIDEANVYYGNASSFSSPAVVRSSRVFARINEYQEIMQRGLTEDDAEYHLLLRRASQLFLAAVEAIAKDKSHDFVGERDFVGGDPPDITDEVIRELSN